RRLSGARALCPQDEVVDRCAEAPDPPEAPAQQLPEGDFIDGLLGLLEEDALASRLAELEDEQLYEDADFPADASSLSYSDPNDEALADIVWMRPHELVDEPALFVDGVSRGDVKQGDLGDCWFLSACASVARRPDLIERVVSPGQPLYGPGYQGVVAVRLWRFGAWVSVHVDDRLPTRDGRLLYASCADPREFWVAFIEKAYAKLHGSYEALAGGHSLEAFVDLTGGLAEKLSLKELPFRQLRIAFEHGAFVTCARRGDWQLATQRDEATGLVQGHAYTVTDVRRLEPREPDGAVRLLRLAFRKHGRMYGIRQFIEIFIHSNSFKFTVVKLETDILQKQSVKTSNQERTIKAYFAASKMTPFYQRSPGVATALTFINE
ncbi:Calpain-C, partial [Gryllus bimaculatus]